MTQVRRPAALSSACSILVPWMFTFAVVLMGCDGAGDPGPARPDAGPARDAGPITVPRGACVSAVRMANFFVSEGCATPACHGGGRPPDLRYAALGALRDATSSERAGHALVVPNRPEESELFLRIAGPRPDTATGVWWMPVGTVGPRDAGPVEEWIGAGAPLDCDDDAGVPPGPPPITNPNDYSDTELFTCSDPSAPTSSVARLRRINDREYYLVSGAPGPVVESNPLAARARYSTNSADLSVDGSTLSLLMVGLPTAAASWSSRSVQPPGVGGRYWTSFNGSAAIHTASTPTDAERDEWIDRLLVDAILFRTPTADEHDRLRAMLDAELLAEAPGQRATTLNTVISAARLMTGALFREEMGRGAASGARRRLSADELGLALGRVLSPEPVSGSLRGEPGTLDVSSHPDWSRPMRLDGHFARLRDAIEDGTIDDSAVMLDLFRLYRGGIDPARLDVTVEAWPTATQDFVRLERGDFWLAEGIAQFFREWLEVEGAESNFKERAYGTSRFDLGPFAPSGTVERDGYNQQTSPYFREGLLTSLDDTIARAVIESEAAHQDVLRALLTTRTFRVSSNIIDRSHNIRTCSVDADCGSGFCVFGYCGARGLGSVNHVFGVDEAIADTDEARWVTLPASERMGVLTHPAWLAAHGGNFEDDASLVRRGRWIRENLLCNDVPGLELVSVPAILGPSAPEVRARDRVSAATEMPGADGSTPCLGCHVEMNPFGNPFEIYNHAGFLRADDHGMAPDGSTVVDDLGGTSLDVPDSLRGSYASPFEFIGALADSPEVRRCFVRNVFRYFMGRDESPADACTLARLETAFAGGSFFALLESLVTSDAFLYRHDPGGTP